MRYQDKQQVTDRLKKLERTVNYFGKSYVDYKKIAGPWKPRLGCFESAHYYFDPVKLLSTSYNWWPMLTSIGNKLVRNNFHYSRETARDQRKLSVALKALGIKPQVTFSVRAKITDRSGVIAELIYNYAEAVIKLEYCQAKSKGYYKSEVSHAKKELSKLPLVGYGKISELKLSEEVTAARGRREARLKYTRETRRFKERTKQIANSDVRPANIAPLQQQVKERHLKIVE